MKVKLNPNVGDCFEVGQVWESPRGTLYKVVEGGYEETTHTAKQAVLRLGLDGAGRKLFRQWDAVINWCIYRHKIESGHVERPNEIASEKALEVAMAESIPMQKRCRWFVKRGATTWFNRGFRSKEGASNWIDAHGSALDWRCGFLFRLRGEPIDIEIVDRMGNRASA